MGCAHTPDPSLLCVTIVTFMANTTKKILQKGYNTSRVSRGYFNNQMDELETERQFHKKKACTHELVVVPPNGFAGSGNTKAQQQANLFQDRPYGNNYFSHGATVSVCSKCAKIIIKWNG